MLITTVQLRGAGLTDGQIHHRVRSGRLHRLHRTVLAAHPPPYSQTQRWLAAVLACGRGAALSHEPAAVHQTLLVAQHAATHVTVPGNIRSRDGLTVHRSPLDPRDLRMVGDVPCTSADRILVDLAPTHSEQQLEEILVAAESVGYLKRGRLADLVSERHGRPGIQKLERLIALEPQFTRSEFERLMLPLTARARLPRPKTNYPVRVPGRTRPVTVDLAWPDLRLALEADSQRFHGDWKQATEDRERDQLLALAGWLCHRFVRSRVVGDPEAAVERLGALYGARAATPTVARR